MRELTDKLQRLAADKQVGQGMHGHASMLCCVPLQLLWMLAMSYDDVMSSCPVCWLCAACLPALHCMYLVAVAVARTPCLWLPCPSLCVCHVL